MDHRGVHCGVAVAVTAIAIAIAIATAIAIGIATAIAIGIATAIAIAIVVSHLAAINARVFSTLTTWRCAGVRLLRVALHLDDPHRQLDAARPPPLGGAALPCSTARRWHLCTRAPRRPLRLLANALRRGPALRARAAHPTRATHIFTHPRYPLAADRATGARDRANTLLGSLHWRL